MDKSLVFTPGCEWEVKSGDWGDVLADSARYIYMKQPRCSGKTLWLSNIAKSIEEDARNDATERWLKAMPIKPLSLGPGKLYIHEENTGEVKELAGVSEFSSTIARYRGTVYTHPYSPNGKTGHMLITPPSERTMMYLDAEIGDIITVNDNNNGITWPSAHGRSFMWKGKDAGWEELKKDVYFDTDMAMTKEEMQYCRNDVAVTEKLFKEEQIMRFNSCKPTIKNVIFNDPATIVMWSDGTKTVVKCSENDIFDPEKGVAMCCMKKLIGTNKTGSNYLDKVQEYFNSYIGEAVNNVVIGEILGSIFGSKKKPSNSKDIPPEVTVEKEFEAVTSNDWEVVPADENTIAEENGE